MENGEENHVYWFKHFWLHQIYCVGLERFANRINGNVPHKEQDTGGIRRIRGKGQSLFYWESTFNSDCNKVGPPNVDVFGKTLYARNESKAQEYKPTIHVRYQKPSPSGIACGGLYAARPYNVGDAILFFSQLEETQGVSLFGGVHVRVIEHPFPVDCGCNAYLTANRTLPCKRPMKTGDPLHTMWNTRPSRKN